MSYRLIDANAIAIVHPEVNDMPCIYADLPDGLDGLHYDLRELGKLQDENDRLRRLCLELYRKYRHVEGVLFVDLDMDELEGRLQKLGMETWETLE